MVIGFVVGAIVFSFSDHEILKKLYPSLSKDNNSNIENINKNNKDQSSRPESVLIGSILDSVPESIFIGIVIALNIQGLVGAAIALFLGNISATLDGTKRILESKKKRKN